MGSHGRPKKKIAEEFPQVAALAQCLRDLMDVRGVTKDKLLTAAGIRGHSRLDRYLNGEAVPEEKLLKAFFLKPLEAVRELDDEEERALQERYRAAVEEQPPRKATPSDQVPILENDLAAAKNDLADAEKKIERVWRLVALFAVNGEQHRQVAEELRGALRQVEAGLAAAKQQLRDSEEAERQSHAQTEALKFQASWYTQNLTQRAMEIDSLHEHARVMEASLVKALQTISRQGETIQELEDKQLLNDRVSALFRSTIASLEKARSDDEAKYRRALDEWDQAVQGWEREKTELTGQLEKLQREAERKAENSQVSVVSPEQVNAAGAVVMGRAAWHPDGSVPNLEAYWNGHRWTGEKRPAHPAVRKTWRPKGRHAKPEPAEVERNAAAAWQGYCIGYQVMEHQPPGWASSIMAHKPYLPTLLMPRHPMGSLTADAPARQAFEGGFWHAIENRCLTEGEVQKSFRRSKRHTGGGRHASPTNSTVPDLPLVNDALVIDPAVFDPPGIASAIPRSPEHLHQGDGSWSTGMAEPQETEHNEFWATTASRFRLKR